MLVRTASRAYSNKSYFNFSLPLLGQSKMFSVPQHGALLVSGKIILKVYSSKLGKLRFVQIDSFALEVLTCVDVGLYALFSSAQK